MANPDIVVIEAALNGLAIGRDRCPTVPWTPEEIAAEARRALDAGAGIVRFFARGKDGRASFTAEDLRGALEAVRTRIPGPVHLSLFGPPGGQAPSPTREETEELLAGIRPDLVSVDMAGGPDEAVRSLETLGEARLAPIVECARPSHVEALFPILERGRAGKILRVGLMPEEPGRGTRRAATRADLADLLPAGAVWIGGGRGPGQWAAVDAALRRGGHVRVGFEDNILLREGLPARSNAELVERAVAMARAVGRDPADPDAAWAALGIDRP